MKGGWASFSPAQCFSASMLLRAEIGAIIGVRLSSHPLHETWLHLTHTLTIEQRTLLFSSLVPSGSPQALLKLFPRSFLCPVSFSHPICCGLASCTDWSPASQQDACSHVSTPRCTFARPEAQGPSPFRHPAQQGTNCDALTLSPRCTSTPDSVVTTLPLEELPIIEHTLVVNLELPSTYHRNHSTKSTYLHLISIHHHFCHYHLHASFLHRCCNFLHALGRQSLVRRPSHCGRGRGRGRGRAVIIVKYPKVGGLPFSPDVSASL